MSMTKLKPIPARLAVFPAVDVDCGKCNFNKFVVPTLVWEECSSRVEEDHRTLFFRETCYVPCRMRGAGRRLLAPTQSRRGAELHLSSPPTQLPPPDMLHSVIHV